MKTSCRSVLLTLSCCLTMMAAVAPSANAGFGVEEKNWEAGTCKELVPSNCKYSNGGSFFTEAAGHPLWGVTKFTLNHSGNEVEGAPLKRLRVEIPKGLAANPEALATCSEAAFEAETCPAASKAGTTELSAVAEPLGLAKIPLEGLTGEVYNLGQRAGNASTGLPLLFGISVAPAGALITPVHLLLKGHVAWASDYHEYFEIDNVPTTSTVKVGPLEFAAALKIESFPAELRRNQRRQLPHVAERMLHDHYVAPRSRIVQPRNLAHPDPHAGRRGRLRKSPVQTDDGNETRTVTVRLSGRRHDGRQSPAVHIVGKHRGHQGRARHPAGRVDAQPIRRSRTGSLHAVTAGRAHRKPGWLPGGVADRRGDDRNGPSGGHPDRQRLPRQAEQHGSDHRPSLP